MKKSKRTKKDNDSIPIPLSPPVSLSPKRKQPKKREVEQRKKNEGEKEKKGRVKRKEEAESQETVKNNEKKAENKQEDLKKKEGGNNEVVESAGEKDYSINKKNGRRKAGCGNNKLNRENEEANNEEEACNVNLGKEEEEQNQNSLKKTKERGRKKEETDKKQREKQNDQRKEEENESGFTFAFEREGLDNSEIEYPFWLKPENLRDEMKRRPDEEGYDPSTLWISEKEINKMSLVFRQYWEIKKKNFDKIIFFRFGMSPMCFYEDAHLISTITDIRLQFWGSRPFVNVWPKQQKPTIEKLLSLGHKIAIVEQMESADNRKDDILDRQIVEVITPGNYNGSFEPIIKGLGGGTNFGGGGTPAAVEGGGGDYDGAVGGKGEKGVGEEGNNFKRTLIILEKDNKFGVVIVEVAVQIFWVDEIQGFEELKNLIFRIRPVEVVWVKGKMEGEVINWIRKCFSPAFSPSAYVYEDIEGIEEKLRKFFKNGEVNKEFPKCFEEIFLQNKNSPLKNKFYLLIQTINLTYNYFESCLLLESIFAIGNFDFVNLESLKSQNLYLDAQTLINLEIFESSSTPLFNSSSLFGRLNQTKSPFGRRLLKNWLETPLRKREEIIRRQECIESFMENLDLMDFVRGKIGRMTDLERNLGKIYSSNNKQKLSLSWVDNFVCSKLSEVLKIMADFKQVDQFIRDAKDYLPKKGLKSPFLKKLLSYKSEGGALPEFAVLIKEIETLFQVQEGMPFPKSGIDEKFDKINYNVEKIKEKLNQILVNLRKKVKCDELVYIQNKQRRYEIEAPDKFNEIIKQNDFFITSKRKGFTRFQNDYIDTLLSELREGETLLSSSLQPFFLKVFKFFYDRRPIWMQTVHILAELDCLATLAVFAISLKDKGCKPILAKEDDGRCLQMKKGYHPCLIKKEELIPNDVIFEEGVDIMLITGPNMAGKSTLMRLVSLNLILAHIGSYACCSFLRFSVFDRIFTRLGCSDRLFEGKSTFFIEMEEALNIISNATDQSLVIIDELGRGTSTFDGLSIAYSVLRFLAEKIKPKTLFASHFHNLAGELGLMKNIEYWCLDYELNGEVVKFLYTFKRGQAEQSFGANIARMAGLPLEVVLKGKEKGDEMSREKEGLTEIKKRNEQFNEIILSLSDLRIDINYS